MKKIVYLFVFICFSTVLNAQIDSSGVYPGVLRVKLEGSANKKMIYSQLLQSKSKIESDKGATLKMGIKSLDILNSSYKVKSIKRVFPYAGIYEAKHEKYGLNLWYDIEFDTDYSPLKVAENYVQDANIISAQPIYKIQRTDREIDIKKVIDSAIILPSSSSVEPNDEHYSKQWHYQNTGQTDGVVGVDIRLNKALAITSGKKEVVVAVVDGGIDYSHVDLMNNVWVNEAEKNGSAGIDDDGNTYIDDIHGYNFVQNKRGAIIPAEHGTHVAGTIAATSNNSVGVTGVAGGGFNGELGVRVMSCQVFTDDDNDQGNTAEAIVYGADNGALISQNSWGYKNQITEATFMSSDVKDAIDYFIAEAGTDHLGNPRPGTLMKGGIVIFAAGNNGTAGNWYPARYNKVLSVGAVNHYGRKAYYSNYGDWVDITAPGGDTREKTMGGVLSTVPNNKYKYLQGTSMACPHVSGIAALVLSKFGSDTYTPDLLWNRLVSSTNSLEQYEPDYYQLMGAGLIDAEKALLEDNGIAPDKIIDLACEALQSKSAVITWLSPKDDDSGNASLYEVAVSISPINEGNFEPQIIATIDNVRQVGSKEEYTIRNLTTSTTYYAAVRSQDIWGNTSAISNVVTFTTLANGIPEVGTISPITMRDIDAMKDINLLEVFTEPDGETLTFTVNNPSPIIAEAEIQSSNRLIITPKSAGNVVFAVTAKDPQNAQVTGNFDVTVTQNQAPVRSTASLSFELKPREKEVVSLNTYYADPENDAIQYLLSSVPENVKAEISNSTLTITALRKGDFSFDVIAKDIYGAQGENMTINVSVAQVAPEKAGELLLYPVPVEGNLNYSFILDKTADVEIRAYTTEGRLVYRSAKTPYTEGTVAGFIETSSWPAGVYIIEYLVNGKSIDAKRVIK